MHTYISKSANRGSKLFPFFKINNDNAMELKQSNSAMLPKTAKTPKKFVKNTKLGLTCMSKYKYYGNVK